MNRKMAKNRSKSRGDEQSFMDLARKSTIASTRTILCALVSLRLFICETMEEKKKERT